MAEATKPITDDERRAEVLAAIDRIREAITNLDRGTTHVEMGTAAGHQKLGAFRLPSPVSINAGVVKSKHTDL